MTFIMYDTFYCMDEILGIQSAIEIAYIPKRYEDVMDNIEIESVYEMLYRYYKQNVNSVSPDVYGIQNDGDKTTTHTTIGRPDEDEIGYSKITSEGLYHSHYSKKALKDIGIDLNDSWNGNAIGVRHQDNELNIVETDYYTTSAYSRLLFLEAANALDRSNSTSDAFDMMPLRQKFLSSLEDFYRPSWISREGTVGGIVISYNGDSWEIIIGERSEKPRVNPRMISIVPNGGIGYESISKGGVEHSLKSHFDEEFFKGKYQPKFFEDYVKSYRILNGWNLRDASFIIGFLLVIPDKEGYKRLTNRNTQNFEFKSLINIDVQNADRITEIASISKMSPSTIPYVYRGLNAFEQLEYTPKLEYDILEGC